MERTKWTSYSWIFQKPLIKSPTSVCSINWRIMGSEDKLSSGSSTFCSTALKRLSCVCVCVCVGGYKSPKADVISGVPQCTVLCPLLFLVFINDLPEAVHSSDTCLFADDCLLFKHISSDKDSSDLQDDLTALEQWETK